MLHKYKRADHEIFLKIIQKKFVKNIDISTELCYYHYIILIKKLNHGRGAMRHQYSFRLRFPITVEAQKGAFAESVRKRVRIAWFDK